MDIRAKAIFVYYRNYFVAWIKECYEFGIGNYYEIIPAESGLMKKGWTKLADFEYMKEDKFVGSKTFFDAVCTLEEAMPKYMKAQFLKGLKE